MPVLNKVKVKDLLPCVKCHETKRIATILCNKEAFKYEVHCWKCMHSGPAAKTPAEARALWQQEHEK